MSSFPVCLLHPVFVGLRNRVFFPVAHAAAYKVLLFV